MLNFTVGPVMSNEEIRKIGGDQIPYFRTPEFSKVMLENELLLKKFFKAKDSSRVIFMTGSGTASMDASILNLFTKDDKILIVNGGSFGHRFVEICSVYDLTYTVIKCELGKTLTKEQLIPYENKGYTTEAVKALSEWASKQPNVKQIEAETEETNIASIRVLEKSNIVSSGIMGQEGPRFIWKG